MAFEFVSALARTRQQTGISWLLFPHPVAQPVDTPAQTKGRTSARPPSSGPAGRSGFEPGFRASPGPGREVQRQPQQGRQDTVARQERQGYGTTLRRNAAPARPAPTGRTGSSQAQAARPAPVREASPEVVASWPENWQRLFARTRPGKVAWTYYGLGHDLCGQANRARSRKLTELIAFLAMPRGTHTFWPIGLPSQDEDGNAILVVNRDIFWQGLQLLNARMLIIMGSPAAKSVGIQGPLSPTMPMRPVNGMLTLLTWDIDDLDNEDHFIRTRNYLRQTLTPLVS